MAWGSMKSEGNAYYTMKGCDIVSCDAQHSHIDTSVRMRMTEQSVLYKGNEGSMIKISDTSQCATWSRNTESERGATTPTHQQH
jgi:hypothetical protein